MVLDREEGLECEVCVDKKCLEHVLEFKYFGCVLDKGTDEAYCSRKMAMGGGLQVLLGLWLKLGVCSLSVLGSCMSDEKCGQKD